MKLAIFYHCILSGGSVPVDTEWACSIMDEQMIALRDSGLLAATEEVYIGLNGDNEDAAMAMMFAPPKAKIIIHGKDSTTEIPTLNYLRNWLSGCDADFVLYHHIKGVTHKGSALYEAWRRCMERAVVWQWRDCIEQMRAGADSCGAHWMTPEKFPGAVNSPYWGGTFWWATTAFLRMLPILPAPTWENRFEAENWIGRGPRRPKVVDRHFGWPSMKCL